MSFKRTPSILPGALVIFVLMIVSCQKQISGDFLDTPPVIITADTLPVVLQNTPVTVSVAGKVTDENNNPVNGAVVTGGGKTTTTDVKGIYRINKGNFNGTFATVKIEKENYFTLVKTFSSKSGETKYVPAKLSAKTLAGTVAVNGGSVDFTSGNVNISFPANAFVNSAGIAVTAPVSVFITYIDPSALDANQRMPGNMSGVESPSTTYILNSYGMLAVELKDAANNTVKMAPGKKATITASIPASLLATAPATIPLWYFDESKGVWVKQGEATKTGNTYKGEVSHFTFWNMDSYTGLVFFNAHFVNAANGNSLSYSHVSYKIVGGNGYVYDSYTDGGGYDYGLIAKNVPVQMKFYLPNGTVGLDTLIGPYTADVNDIGNVYISLAPADVIKGTLLDCNGQPITHGSITVTIDSLDYHSSLNSNGQFLISLGSSPALNTPIYLTGIDSSNNASVPAQTITYTGNHNMSIGLLFTCTNPPAEFISYTLDGSTVHTFIRNLDSAFCNRTYAFNRTEIACRRANGSPMVEGYVTFITGPTTVGGTDTSAILTLHQYSNSSTPKTLNIISFTESYYAYPPMQGVEGWVIGTYTCVFTDDIGTVHTTQSNFRMWRRN